jgi:NADP-dependent 3-hydroxy acid dehydrogenase YdfG
VQLPTYPFERQRYWIDAATTQEPLGRKRNEVRDWFYLPYEKPTAPPQSSNLATGTWLVIADTNHGDTNHGDTNHGDVDNLADQLRARGAAVITAEPADDFAPLIREHHPQRIVHLGAFTDETRFDPLQDAGYHSLVRLVQALDGDARIDVIASNLDHTPGKATLRAPVMVAPQERPGITIRCIDVDDARPILDELLGEAREPFVTYRDGRRFVQAFEPVSIERPRETPFRQHGVYLLTGGLGGVGMVLARQLAERVQARLVLVGRSEPAPEKQRQIDALGTETLVLRADVSKIDDMRRVLAAVEDRFGELHGVIHGAGAVGVETFREIRQITPADAEAQFAAKVRGVQVLDELLAGRDLDFVVLLSSLSAILGGLGFCAYSAANLFMDSFARTRRGWTSVDWDSWRLTDTRPVIAGLGATVSEFVMEPEEGFAAFESIVAARTLGQVIVSSGDLQARLQQWVEHKTAAAAPAAKHNRPSLRTAYEAPRGELESDLAAIWQELFGVAQIGVHDNFFELGGHSLLATQLNARLSSKLRTDLSLAALLQAPTIAELAVVIVARRAEEADPELLERMLEELLLTGRGE